MTDEPREELISAYLDGELADHERAEVEKMLAENSHLRQLHDELRALRSGMQSLERHRVEHDLSGAVLRRAEQSVLRGTAAKSAPATTGVGGALVSWWNRGAGWRRILWPAVAVAAALAILVYDANRRPAERQIAQQPEPAEGRVDVNGDVAAPADLQTDAFGTNFGTNQAAGEDFDRPDAANELRSLGAPPAPANGRAPAESMRSSNASKAGLGARPYDTETEKLELLKQPEAIPLFARTDASNGIVLQVTPAYLKSGAFEKLLDGKKIKWQRLMPPKSRAAGAYYSSRDAADKAAEGVAKLGDLRATYVLEADRKQVDSLLSSLGQREERFARKKDQPRRGSPPRKDLAESVAGKVTVILVAPATEAAPAAPPAADQP